MRIVTLFTRVTLVLLGCGLLLLLRPPRVINLDAPAYDPAIEAELKSHTVEFGGVDRWTFPGMPAGLLVTALTAAGYACPSVQDPLFGGTPGAGVRGKACIGVHQQICSRHRGFPLPRDLVVQASVDFGRGGGLTGIKARRVDFSRNALVQGYAKLLRALNLIEPDTLTVKGLSFDSSADLARYVVDTLNPNSWRGLCDTVTLDPHCKHLAERRRAEGFPKLTDAPIAASLDTLVHTLRAIGIHPRPEFSSAGPLPVYLEADEFRLDLQGADFSGAMRRVSVLLAMQGATPLGLRIRQGDSAPVTVAVNGTARKTASYYILPGDIQ